MRVLITFFFCTIAGQVLAQAAVEDKPLLDVSIRAFDINLPEDSREQQARQIYPAVRQAEARYLPSFLKLMLEESGQWGAVRLLPQTDTGAELQVTADILDSDGSTLSLAFKAIDATGRTWIDQTYTRVAVDSVSLNQPVLTDPFLYLYSDICNDLAAFYATLTHSEVNEIKAVATLRYAAALAPEVFEPYLAIRDTGRISYTRLPADNDPFLLRVEAIRDHEYVFIDVVDEQYESFFVAIKPVYDLWRKYRREIMASEADKINREIDQGNGFRRGSYMSLRESYNNYRWARMQDQYLEELNQGFINEIQPTDITLEDSLYHLNGTLVEQYSEWRDILKQLYKLDGPVGD
jgi:hypothetical protein